MDTLYIKNRGTDEIQGRHNKYFLAKMFRTVNARIVIAPSTVKCKFLICGYEYNRKGSAKINDK